jgi:hypothetical protein
MVPEISGLDLSEIIGGDDESGLEGLLDGDDESGGSEQFVGDDESGSMDILGAVVQARRNRNKKLNNAMQALLLKKRAQAGTLVEQRAPRKSREYVLGLGSTSITGNASANINVQPQVVFQPQRILIPSNIAQDFLLTDIKVGKNSQLASTGAVPAVAFTESAFGVRLKMDTAQISMYVTISVTNQNAQARVFQGCLIGPAVE